MASQTALQIVGDIPQVLRNDAQLYEGDLVHYGRVIFHNAQNLQHPYHNLRHMLHVVWLCYNGCAFYADALTPRQMRDLLIAAAFHDINHSGMLGDDDLNIERAVRTLDRYILEEDRPHYKGIAGLIRITQYPYTVGGEALELCGQILRDADVSQVFSAAWIQQVVVGLAVEWGKKPIEVLRIQEPFLTGLRFLTDWARQMFPDLVVEAKIKEARELLALFEDPV